MRIFISFDEKEEGILKALLNKFGGKPQALIRQLVKEKYESAFPAYKMKGGVGAGISIPELEIAPEILAERLGGKVNAREGQAEFYVGALKVNVPLNNTKEMLDILNKYRVQAGQDPVVF